MHTRSRGAGCGCLVLLRDEVVAVHVGHVLEMYDESVVDHHKDVGHEAAKLVLGLKCGVPLVAGDRDRDLPRVALSVVLGIDNREIERVGADARRAGSDRGPLARSLDSRNLNRDHLRDRSESRAVLEERIAVAGAVRGVGEPVLDEHVDERFGERFPGTENSFVSAGVDDRREIERRDLLRRAAAERLSARCVDDGIAIVVIKGYNIRHNVPPFLCWCQSVESRLLNHQMSNDAAVVSDLT